MDVAAGEAIAHCIEEKIARHGFKPVEPLPRIDSADIIAAWKRKTLNTNRAIALVAIPSPNIDPGAFAKSIKLAVGKQIGYITFFHDLGLQLVLIGRNHMRSITRLEDFVDKEAMGSVTLQSIHLVDLEVDGGPDLAPLDKAPSQESIAPPWWVGWITFLNGYHTLWLFHKQLGEPESGKKVRQFSQNGKKAFISIRAWGQSTTGRYIDAIEEALAEFVNR